MKKIFFATLLACLAVLSAQSQNQIDESQYVSKKFKLGEQVSDLIGNSPDGKEYRLKEIVKGRYLIVDFWASWCKPCRISNPHLVKGYNAIKDKRFKNAPKGVAVVSVSLDMDVKSWKTAIEKDKLNWDYHLSDLKGWDSPLAAAWGVEVVPQVFLISPEGKLLGVYLSAETALTALRQYIQ